ncbi:sporulation protein YqfD [Youxingia wuxianensis]|uniref:Sporulation protein YqfD n=1 Tax=Youxingia wuxianensis TaxID=2763678 RepID=A0A926EPH5_9FIRM|nr:sporulation protein YqfD [Youxingia wuxianensis]MBC8585032.1 sporulation protein YqfD [Youxingia wuxianensis]
MYIVKLLRFLKGYVKFDAISGNIERFINICVKNCVSLWGCRKEEEHLTGFTTVSGYKKMHRYARRTQVRLRVKERRGLPFYIHRYRKRIGILAGALCFVLFLGIMSNFVWVIQIEGNERLSSQQLINALKEAGVSRGTLKSSIDNEQVAQTLMIKVDDLAWISVNVRGTTVFLRVRERTMPPQKIDTNVPANVVAAQDGQIRHMEVYDGTPVLKVGDAVRKGEIIVSGINEDRWGLTHILRANAKVTAYVPQTLEVEIPLTQTHCSSAGKIIKRKYLNIFGAQIPLFIYSGIEEPYKLEKREFYPQVMGVSMPFTVTRENYILTVETKERISEDTALKLGKKQLALLEKQKLNGEIISFDVKARTEEEKVILTGEYIVEMDIAKQVEFSVFDTKDEKGKFEKSGY